jgi:hypothetical protein
MLAGSGVTAAPLICVGSPQQQALDVTTAVQVGCAGVQAEAAGQ